MVPQETEEGSREPNPRPRIQTLSDLVFGLALSIGAISLLSAKPSDAANLVYSISAFGFSFLILALVWLRYTTVMSVLPTSSGKIVAPNMVMLFLVSIEPYLYSLISFQPAQGQIDPGTVTSAYAIDLGLVNLILVYFVHVLTIEEKKLAPSELLKSYRLQRNAILVAPAIFLFSALPLFAPSQKIGLWALTFGTYPVRRLVNWRWQQEKKSQRGIVNKAL